MMENQLQYIEEMKNIQANLLNLLDNDIEENFNNLCTIFEDLEIKKNLHKLKTILHLIVKISNNHYRRPYFFYKLERVLLLFKDEIKKYFSNSSIFNIFKNCKRIILFLLEENIMTFDKYILDQILSQHILKYDNYQEYFAPEIIQLKSEQWFQVFLKYDEFYILHKELPENFYEKRKEGENDSFICKIIRKDLIEDFIIYVKKQLYPLNSKIDPSIYETNTFLLKNKNPSLIEYAAFFGSNQIFNYLHLNGAKLTPSLWLYAIHGESEEIIHFLEENHIDPPFDGQNKKSYFLCFKESIKCHRNNYAFYFLMNYLESEIENTFDAFLPSLKYYNFELIQNKFINEKSFIYLCKYDYCALVNILIKEIDIDLNKPIEYMIWK